MCGEPAVVLLSAAAMAAALLVRIPHHTLDAAALLVLSLCAGMLDVRGRAVRNSAFGFRRAARQGLSLGLTTVPCALVAVLLSTQHAPAGEAARRVRFFYHASLVGSATILMSIWAGSLDRRAAPIAHAQMALLAALMMRLLFPDTAVLLVLGASAAAEPVLRLLLARLPGCFSLGEAAAIAQAVSLLAVDVALLVGCGWAGARHSHHDALLCASRDIVLAVAEVGLFCALLLGPWLVGAFAAASAASSAVACARARSSGGGCAAGARGSALPTAAIVYPALAAFLPLVLYPALACVLGEGEGPLSWLVAFLSERSVRLLLLGYWAVLATAGTALIGAVRTRMPLIVVRKLYHALAVLLFLPGMLLEQQLMRLAFAVAISLFLALEYVRISGAPPLAKPLGAFLARYTDARDAGPLITTHIYLLLGCALPVLATPSAAPSLGDTSQPSAVLPPMAGILALGVGDSMASYVGTRLGRTHWPGTAKTVEGTAAAVSAIVVGAGALCVAAAAIAPAPAGRLGGDVLLRILAATVSTCVLEAVTDQIDNLFLPLHFFCALRVALGAPQY